MKAGRKRFVRIAAAMLAGAIPLAARLALLPYFPIPVPAIHDEFSYLLAADTFAHGRLTNPAHPLWKFFESFHIIQQPTYMSMYPPMQGLILAFGRVVFGHPFWGVCISGVLMGALICWVLQEWLPPLWALAGSLLLAAKLTFAWWNCYWGGAAAAIGGCLLLGSFTRLIRPTTRPTTYSILMATGTAILANSRPWEGAMFSLPIVAALVWWIFRARGETLARRLSRVLAPFIVIMALTAGGMAYYNWRITGSAWTLPYMLHWKTYRVEPLFVWQRERPAPSYNHEVMRRLHTQWEPDYQGARKESTVDGWLKAKLTFYPLVISATLLVSLFLIRRPGVPLLAAILGAFLVGLCLQRYILLHYIGPILPVVTAVCLMILRKLAQWQMHGYPAGRAAALVFFVAAFAWMLRSGLHTAESMAPKFGLERAALERRLTAIPGDHLVIVRYGPKHWIHDEWVYNAADIDRSRIIWARDMGSANQQLLIYYRHRKIWLLEPEPPSIRLQEIPADAAINLSSY